jgi:hypothetical protein
LEELEALDDELRLLGEQIGKSPVSDEIHKLRERVQGRDREDVYFPFGTQVIRIDRDIIKALPLGFGNITLGGIKLMQRLTEWWKSRAVGQ